MKKIFNIFPIGGGSAGALAPIYIHTITWHSIGDLALQTAILAFVGGLIGWGVKHAMDELVKRARDRKDK